MGAAQSGQLDARESAAVAGEHVLEAMGAVSCRRGRTKVQVRQVRVGPRLAGKARSVGEGRSVPGAQREQRRGKCQNRWYKRNVPNPTVLADRYRLGRG